MGDITTSALDPRTAALQIRPGANAALRPTDPTKERFQVGERKVDENQTSTVDEQTTQFSVDADDGAAANGAVTERPSRGGRGLLGAFTNFLTKLFTQGDSGMETGASTRLAGMGAYGRSNAQQTMAATASPLPDVQNPGLPQLASGRVLDLMA